MSSNFNPFLIQKNKEKSHILKIERFLKEESSFYNYSEKKNSHMPRALFGRQNYLNYLKEFVLSEDSNLYKIEDISADILEEELSLDTTEYNLNFLYNNFKFRLTTQDRFYESLNFPISLLERLFKKFDDSTFFEDWIHEHIFNIKFHTEKKTFLFSEIKLIEIDGAGVVKLTDNHNKTFELVNKRDNGEIVELRVNELRDLAIDHIVPFNEFYLKNKNRFIVLQKIHNALLKINNDNFIKKRGGEFTEAKNIYLEGFTFKEETINELKSELNFITENVELQMMQRLENLRKNRKA
jgi:hypothetical protein